METTGQRIARARHRKGWDQATLATEAGRSVSWVSKVENGRVPVDRMSVLAKLANVLGVEVVELTGQPYRHETEELDSGHGGIPALRRMLHHATLPGGSSLVGSRPPRSHDELAAEVQFAERLRQDAKFTALGEVLPGLIESLIVSIGAASGTEVDRLEALMLRTCHMARVTANLLGHHDLGWTAVQRELTAAQRVGSPELVAAATWDMCGVWLHGASIDDAKATAITALDALDPIVGGGDPTILSLWGAMHLRAAVAYSRLWSKPEADAHLTEAARVAALVPSDGNVFQTQFNQVNVTIHAVEIATELGRPRDAVTSADEVAIGTIASAERQSHYWVCSAAGFFMNRQEDKAVESLLQADRIAPQHVRNRPQVRNLVDDLRTSGKHTKSREVRSLATRMGLA
ncbi:helix-turn-helix domain-containing protein [Embleya hyalina]|uniref:Transcriptional regulator n=1 Tax=Embleya hyalina TaxID=516124 RepID=A0A401YUV8_9ACTN|nr:helix-turn-helix transcriptional regulator [Embleya hyalina]GCD98335.1 transcriptional regulator [Embleya hyalina]